MTDTGIIALQNDEQSAGAIVWWSLSGNTDIEDARETLELNGFDKSWFPTPPRLETVAMRAAKAAVDNKRQLCRPLTKRGECEFITERVVVVDDEETIAHVANARVTIVGDGDAKEVLVQPSTEDDVALATKIAQSVQLYRGLLTATDISNWLLGILTTKIQAVSLRERGGFYFVPHGEELTTWGRVCDIVRSISGHTLYSMPAMRSEEAVEAILASVRREAAAEMAKHQEYLAGETSSRGLNAAERHLGALQLKIERYAELLGVELPELTAHTSQLLGGVQAARILKKQPPPTTVAP